MTSQKLTGQQEIRQNLAKLYSEAEKSGVSTVYGMCNIDLVRAYFPEWEWVSTNPGRSDTGLSSQFIYTSSEGPTFRSTDAMYSRESRYLPDNFSINFTIIGDTVFFTTTESEQPVGYYIKSAGLTSDMLSLFNVLWDRAEH